jgi:CubicO group peptidase (beta-lactamase class C family)
MVGEPGGRMIYSTGNSHILAAILTEQTGRSLLQLSREWLGQPLNIRIRPWLQSPEGVYFGGNEMYLSARALVWIGEVYRNKGIVDGVRVVSEFWIEQSLQPKTRSVYTDDPYGYGWFLYSFGDVQAYYGRGYGGQILYVIPELDMSIAVISDPTPPSRGSYLQTIHRFVENQVLPIADGH